MSEKQNQADNIQENQNEVTTTTGHVPATEGQPGRGFEHVDMDSVTMPRVKLLQSTSPEVEDSDYDFKPGEIIHGLLMEKLPEKFVPLIFFNSNILFMPREAGKREHLVDKLNLHDGDVGDIICRADDGKYGDRYGSCAECGLNQWVRSPEGDTPPICSPTINVLALFEGQEMPVVIKFAVTSYSHGKRFRDMAFYGGGDLFAKKYKLIPKKIENDKGKYFVLTVKPGGKATEEEYQQAEALYKRFSDVTIEVEDEEDAADVYDAASQGEKQEF